MVRRAAGVISIMAHQSSDTLDRSSSVSHLQNSSVMLEYGMDDPAVAALRRLVEQEGGATVVADAIGANDQTIYQILKGVKLPSGNPKGVGPTIRKRLSARYPGWLGQGWTNQQHPIGGPDTWGSLAQQLSHLSLEDVPTTILWESILSSPLPIRFSLLVRDGAMAPQFRPGHIVTLDSQRPARPGDVVLLADAHGNPYLRDYNERQPGHWLATARGPGWQPLDSAADALRVLAVLVGHAWG